MIKIRFAQFAEDRSARRRARIAGLSPSRLLCSTAFQGARKASVQRAGSVQASPTEGVRTVETTRPRASAVSETAAFPISSCFIFLRFVRSQIVKKCRST